MMRNNLTVTILIICFVLVATLPFWYNRINGNSAIAPQLELPPGGEKTCVLPTAYMREQHVEVLKEWRDSVVREGKRIYTGKDGKQVSMSLSGTCLRCHSNKETFCDRCHSYSRVSPNCWECHVTPKGTK